MEIIDYAPQVGQRERITQNRIVKLFCDKLHYRYLGNWKDRQKNSNIEENKLKEFLKNTGKYSDKLIKKAISELKKAAGNQQSTLFEANKEVYERLRYGISLHEELGKQSQKVHFIDWECAENNNFAIAEEVTIKGEKTKRPDIVLYINGIAVGVIELKRSTVTVSEGIRQNIGNQKNTYIMPFFTTVQLVMAGNDTEGLRYATTETTEDYYLSWNPEDPDFADEPNLLDRQIIQVCNKERLWEIIHDFIIFDSGIKKICRHNQYFGVKAAQEKVIRREGGIIWHTQGSGKSLTMVWLAKWIYENITDARVILLTDRVELDEQIEGVFLGVNEKIYRTKSSRDLLEQLNKKDKWLLSSLVHKFGKFGAGVEQSVEEFIKEIRAGLPRDFQAKGEIFVFVDECHRSHTGKMHEAMKEILPDACFIGFTGTPLLKIDKTNSIAVWGSYIHQYKYNEAVRDKVVLDLRYEARQVPQQITDQQKIDEFFERKTKGLTDYAKAQLKKRWGTMQVLLSSADRMRRIVFDIIDDFEKKPRLASGRGNAMLVASSIYEACQYYDIFLSQGFEKCAVITSYEPNALDTESREYAIYEKMLDRHRPLERKGNESETSAFERIMKKRFIEYPGQLQLLIVVDKLLTGFDAPPTTYLYIDKTMQDHGLFQAICRVNRLHSEDKDYGYIIDFRDLFKKLEKAVIDYTSEAFAGFEKQDVIGLLKDRLKEGRKDLDEALERVRGLCEPVPPPRDQAAYIRYFCGDPGNPYSLKENEEKRVKLYQSVGKLLRAYADITGSMKEAGYSEKQAAAISKEVIHYEQVRTEIRLASGDHIDLKKYEPAMRALMDRYISASESEKLTSFDDQSLVELLVKNGSAAIDQLPKKIKNNQEAIAEVIENNVRKLITDEMPTNPRYYQQMSELLTELIRKRKQENLEYKNYLEEMIGLVRKVKDPSQSGRYPEYIDTPGKKALYDNVEATYEGRVQDINEAVLHSRSDDWRGHILKERKIRVAIKEVMPDVSKEELNRIMEILKNQNEY
jgi:type I restriction enzyme, R subunit